MTQIQAEIDAYGTYARSSALADFAELWVLQGLHVTAAAVDDYLRDMGWLHKDLELLTNGDEIPDEDDVSGGQDVFDVLRERESALGIFYPFAVDGDVLVRKDDVVAYRVLHAITLSHSYKLLANGVVEAYFEGLVCRVLVARGLRVAHIGALRQQHGSFELALTSARELTGLQIPGLGDRSKHANDERVDAVAHFDWEDGREVNWTFIGQVTCAMSDQWERKLLEPGPQRFQHYLGTIVQPVPFLAVPHHIPRRRLAYLANGDGRMILDRLRLVRWVEEPTKEEREIAELVATASINSPY
jgi:hypothetical protein